MLEPENDPQLLASSTQLQKKSRRWNRESQRPAEPGIRQTLHDIIFEADTPAGRWFDIGLLFAILISILIVALETVPQYRSNQALYKAFFVTEWFLTILFSIEYVARLFCARRPLRYALSFWGIIDLLSVLPSFLTIFIGETSRSLLTLRSIRLLRVFRVLKLWRMINEADELSDAIWKSRGKIIVFLAVVLVAVTISGALMYHVETLMFNVNPETGVNDESHFTSIPQAMYWATVTMTTVGYGDVVPKTAIGKIISAALILLGYSLIIVPTGFVSAQFASQRAADTVANYRCPVCEATEHGKDANFCYRCGHRLE